MAKYMEKTLQNEGYEKDGKHPPENEQYLPSVIKDISGNEIKAFVLEYAKNDDRFRSELLVAFGKPKREQITKQEAEASDRKRYKKVCAGVKMLYEAGGTEAAYELIDEFSKTFTRRRAMLDELASLKKKLLNGKK